MSLIRKTSPERPVAQKILGELEPLRLWRNLMAWEPFRDLGMPMSAMEPMFAPAFEVKETKDSYELRADLPGVKDSDLEIRVSGMQLVITGKREAEAQNESDTLYVYERTFGSFTRSFALPEGADMDQIVAALKDGVLTVHIPKKPEVQPKKIAVSTKTSEAH